MRRLRVGVWLNENIKPTDGGEHGYYTMLTECIANTEFANADICFIGDHERSDSAIGKYKYYSVKARHNHNDFISRSVKFVGVKLLGSKTIDEYFRRRELKSCKSVYSDLLDVCDIIYYPVPMCKFEEFPFIYTLWDLGHMNSYSFPEVSSEGSFDTRKNHFEYIPFKALMVICESETGKMEAVKYLRMNENRIKVLPLFASGVVAEGIEAAKPVSVDEEWAFIHYPAQYWAHKNHYNLIIAFQSVLKKYPELKLLLTGSDKGNKEYIIKTIEENNLKDSIIDLGFVSLAELKCLYQNSRGLIMPTLLGPTSIPPLEALALGCPIAVSDIPGHREQFGSKAIYFNPTNQDEIKDAIEKIINCDRVSVDMNLPSVRSNMVLLDKYFFEIAAIRNTWE